MHSKANFAVLLATLILITSLVTHAQNTELVVQRGHSDLVLSITFSPNNMYLSTADFSGEIRLWDRNTGAMLRKFVGHNEAVNSITFSPDSKLLASGSRDNTVKLWDVTTGREIRSLKGHLSSVNAVAFNRDGSVLASGSGSPFATTGESQDNTVKLWNVHTGREIRTFVAHPYRGVIAMAFSPDGRTLATGGDDKTIKLWNSVTGSLLHTFTGNGFSAPGVAFSPDGKILAGESNSELKLWDVPSGRQIKMLSAQPSSLWGGKNIAFSPDGRLLASLNDGGIILWDVAAGRKSHVIEGSQHTTSVAFSPDGTMVAGASGSRIRLWDVAGNKELSMFSTQHDANPVELIALSSDHRTIASGGRVGLANGTYSVKANPKLWDIASGREQQKIINRTGILSPDTRLLVTGEVGKPIDLIDLFTDRRIRTFSAPYNSSPLAFSPDARTLATVIVCNSSSANSQDASTTVGNECDNKSINLWDVATGKKLNQLSKHSGSIYDGIYAGAFSRDGRIFASKTLSEITLWDVVTFRELKTLSGFSSYSLPALAFNNTGNVLASGEKAFGEVEARGRLDRNFVFQREIHFVRIWDVATGRSIHTLNGHSSYINAVAFSPNDKLLASGSDDQSIKLWDPTTGRELRTLSGHTGSIWSVAFNHDGSLLVSGSSDGTSKVWDVKTGEELASLLSIGRSGLLVVTPKGLFDGTADAMRQVSWRVGETNEIIPLDAFYNTYFYPGLLADIFEGERPKPEVDVSTTLRFPGLRTMARQGLAHIEQRDDKTYLCLAQESSTNKNDVVGVRGRGGAIDLTQSFIKDPYNLRCAYRMELPKDGGPYELSGNTDGWKFDSSKSAEPVIASSVNKSTLHVLTIGVNKYSRNYGPLRFPVADADAIEDFFRRQNANPHKSYADIRIWAGLRNESATQKNIRGRLAEMANEVSDDDVVFLFLSGHGRVPPGQSMFYFIPYVTPKDSWDVSPLNEREEGLSTAMLAEAIRDLPTRRVVIVVDACQSGGAIESLAKVGEVKMKIERRRSELDAKETKYSHDVGVYILAAATPVQEAAEPLPGTVPDNLQHGLLTLALLSTLENHDLADKSGRVWVRTVLEQVRRTLPELAKERQWVQTAFAASIGADFPVASR